MLDKLYDSENLSCNSNCEEKPIDYDENFLSIICDYIVEILRINWKDRETVKNLFYSALENKVCSRDGLLEQFLNSQLDIIAESIKRNFELDKDLKVDYGHATHAKFSTILEVIKEKESSQIKSYTVELLNIEVIEKKALTISFVVGGSNDINYAKECKHNWQLDMQKYPAKDTNLLNCAYCEALAFRTYYNSEGLISNKVFK